VNIAKPIKGNKMTVSKEAFGQNSYGEETELFTLTNRNGVRVRIMTHGATILSIETPDRGGNLADIVLGFDTAAEYGPGSPYFGAAIGRFGNRIAHGKFSLDGKDYQLALNGDGIHALHGGDRGFDKRIWTAEVLEDQNAVKMTYFSPDGEEGYPGNLTASVTYTLTDNNELKLDYSAVTDQATPVNLTNHSYFNLAGHDSGSTANQLMTIHADRFVVTDGTGEPTGELRPVEDTPMDFRTPHAIGERIDADYAPLNQLLSPGYDFTYCISGSSEDSLVLCARTEDPASGRVMETFTTEPGVQFYAGNFLDGTNKGKGGVLYPHRGGFCLETQHYPDGPNRPEFPDTILRPGETYTSQTVYKFSAN
jgi:aldose 1-epimerase